jgi:hypothetical protein
MWKNMVSSASRNLITPKNQECLQIPALTSISDKIFSVPTVVVMVLHFNKNNPVYHLDRL